MALRRFYQLGQHPAGGARVKEGDARIADANTGLRVDQLHTGLLQPAEHVVDVGDGVGDVMKPRAPLLQVLADRGLRTKWPQQLDMALADVEQRGLDPLRFDGLAMGERHPEGLLIEGESPVEVVGGDADVVDPAEHPLESKWREADRPARVPRPPPARP